MIRSAELNDSEFISLMYYIAGPNLFKYFFSSDKESILKLLKTMLNTENTIFSKDFFYVYEDNGVLKGVIALVPGNKVKKLELNAIRYFDVMVRHIGFLKYLKSIYRSLTVNEFPKTEKDELFIQAITVDEHYRGKNVASELLSLAFEKAFEMGYKKVSLFVEIDNERAIKVYKKNGFKIVSTKRYKGDLRKYNILGMHKMIYKV